ncbi:MAG TPA: hypothetical protein VI078_13840 [bacterium]
MAAGLAWLGGCGNALDDGSDPSGSIIRVVSVNPEPATAFTPDIFVDVCDASADPPDTEPGIPNSYATVEMLNESRPNTPTGKSTNSFVTMSRYRVDFTGINKTVNLPSLDGGGLSVGIAPDGTGTITVLVMDLPTLEYIRSHYPTIGTTEGLTLRADISIWGKDAFQADVKATAEVTLVIENYDRCP